MNEEDNYLKYFYQLFLRMQRQGPGDRNFSLKILDQIEPSKRIKTILDIGCGTGAGGLLLAKRLKTETVCLDNYPPFLEQLEQTAKRQGLANYISTVNASMFQLPFASASFDLIWSEGSAYIMGFEKALHAWRPLLRSEGYLFISEMCWFTDSPSAKAVAFWKEEYPAMASVEKCIERAESNGFEVILSEPLPQKAWDNFHADMQQQIALMLAEYGPNAAFEDSLHEIKIFKAYQDEFGYQCYLLKSKAPY